MTEFDRKAILNHLLVTPENVALTRDKLFDVVKKYVDPMNYNHLLEDLTAFLQKGNEDTENPGEAYGLIKILDSSRVKIVRDKCSWQQSIRLAGACLLESHSIEQRYLDTIITQLQHYGPYMFLTEDVILAHAKPEDGVSCLDLSVAIFPEGVPYASGHCAKLVLLLAAEDQEKHLPLLQDILAFISAPGAIEAICACQQPEEALRQMEEIVKAHPGEPYEI